ncbi:MAG: outer membrane protein assembly factor BamB family protein [Planctomycetota bacterium]|jgi:outer membrane protein assembly factor BamB
MQTQMKILAALALAAIVLPAGGAAADDRAVAKRILEESGVKGGLVVHLGCGDGRLTAALGADDRYLVHGLDVDAADVDKARDHVRASGRYGRVSVEQSKSDRLPYADNLVNLIVGQDPGGTPPSELTRVLAPGGVAMIQDGEGWNKTVKPWPEEIDEWTHFLFDATGNAVSNDSVVGPPRHMQWVAGPKNARGHENLGSVSVVVSAAGRVFYIADEGPIASVALPSKWRLIARDAFSGVLLWKKPIPTWEWRLRPFRSGPAQVHRRLVAIGDVVYTTLGYGAPLTALGAATGEVLATYAGTEGTEEIVYAEGVLYLVVGDPRDQEKLGGAVRRGEVLPAVGRRIVAVRADGGEVLWQTPQAAVPEIFPLTLAVSDGRAFHQTTEEIVALEAATGNELWRAARPAELKRRAWASPTLVVHGNVVLTADQAPPKEPLDADRPQPVEWEVTMAGGGKDGQVAAFSAATGEPLWSGPCRQTYNAPPDLLVSDGLLWTGRLIGAKEPGITQALDPQTGEIRRQRPADQEFFNVGMGHHRCYRNRATCRYLVLGRSGVEFVDVKTGEAEAHHWVRGTCQHGPVPANGLVYAPSHTCGCFIKAKLNGFNVLAPASVSSGLDAAGERLERGPAYAGPRGSRPPRLDDWPTYRYDDARSGSTTTAVPAKLQAKWQAHLGGKLSSVVIAEGIALVAQVDAHTVHALDAETGDSRWSFVAGGRVDSPPTVYRGRALFGSADGWVTCLRLSDGDLAWRFRAAPGVRRVVSFDRLESAWPVSGSVLVMDGVVYCAAGRSSFLDGGIRLCRLDAETGKLLSETVLTGYDEQGRSVEEAVRVRGTEMPGALPDVLSSDGRSVFMRHLTFDRQGVEQEDLTPHLFSSVGFLDDTWWHRTYFIYGTNFNAGWGGWWRMGNRVPAGRLMVFDDDSIYGFGRSFMPHGNAGQWQIGEQYRYYASPKEFEPPKPPPAKPSAKQRKGRPSRGAAVTGRSIVPFRWSLPADLEARAMVLAGDTLFVAGPLGKTHVSLPAFDGKEGVRLRAVAVADGATLSQLALEALPVLDGMAAAAGKLYLATKDGKLTCFTGR